MSDTPPPHAETRAARRGIVCPCGGRSEVRRVYRPGPFVIRYRRCVRCGVRLVTREAVVRTRPAK